MPGIGVCVCVCVSVCVCVCVSKVGKMAKDIGMTIRKGIVVSFLPAFLGIPSLHFFKCFFLLLVSVVFFGGGGGGGGA